MINQEKKYDLFIAALILAPIVAMYGFWTGNIITRFMMGTATQKALAVMSLAAAYWILYRFVSTLRLVKERWR